MVAPVTPSLPPVCYDTTRHDTTRHEYTRHDTISARHDTGGRVPRTAASSNLRAAGPPGTDTDRPHDHHGTATTAPPPPARPRSAADRTAAVKNRWRCCRRHGCSDTAPARPPSSATDSDRIGTAAAVSLAHCTGSAHTGAPRASLRRLTARISDSVQPAGKLGAERSAPRRAALRPPQPASTVQ